MIAFLKQLWIACQQPQSLKGRYWVGLLGLASLVGGTCFWLWEHPGLVTLAVDWAKTWVADCSQHHPFLLLVSLAILTLVGLPFTAYYVLTAALLGAPKALLVNVAFLFLQLSASYWIGTRGLRQPLEKLLARKGYKVWSIPQASQHKAIVILRLFPTMPVVLQNYALALGGVPFRRYLLFSWPILAVWMLAIVWSSGSVLQGQWQWATVGLGGLGLLYLASYRYRKRRKATAAKDQPT